MDSNIDYGKETDKKDPRTSCLVWAVRLARAARKIAGDKFTHISFALQDSFENDCGEQELCKALLAGILGLPENDTALTEAYEIAGKCGIRFEFSKIDLKNIRQNSIKITFNMEDGTQHIIIGSFSSGKNEQGCIWEVDGFPAEIRLLAPVILIFLKEGKGSISEITKIVTEFDLNIVAMKVSSREKGEQVCCVIETDRKIPSAVEDKLRELKNTALVKTIN